MSVHEASTAFLILPTILTGMPLIMSNSHFGTVVYLFIELWHSLSKIPTREGVIRTHNLWSENRELIGKHHPTTTKPIQYI